MSKCLMIIEKNTSGHIGLKKAKERGLKVVVVSSNNYCNKIQPEDVKYVDELIIVDTSNIEKTVEKCMEFHEKNPVDGVMTFFEYFVPVTAHVAKALNLPGLSIETALCARNKYLMREALSKGGAPIPAYRPVGNLEEARKFAQIIGFPNVIKPVNLAASRSVLKNNNMQELERHFHEVAGVEPPYGMQKENVLLLEECMEGQEYSVETIYREGIVQVLAITKKLVKGENTFVEVGHVIPASLDSKVEGQIISTALSGIEALGIHFGVTHTEIKHTKEGPKIVEIAARLGGDHIPEVLEAATGIDFWNAAISCALNEKPDVRYVKKLGAAISFLTAEPGKIMSIDGVDTAKKFPGVKEIKIEAKEGDIVNPLNNSLDRLGHIIAIGSDSHEAEFNAKSAMSAVRFLMERG